MSEVDEVKRMLPLWWARDLQQAEFLLAQIRISLSRWPRPTWTGECEHRLRMLQEEIVRLEKALEGRE